MSKETLEEMAENHWNYTKGVIEYSIQKSEVDYEQVLCLCEYLYIEAFKHGYKHGKNDYDGDK